MENGREGGEEETRSNSDWAELTHECLTNILSRLSLEERWKGTMLVCKSWLHTCKDPSLFSVFDLESRFESGTESSLWWSAGFERKVDNMLRSVVEWSAGALKEIRIRHCSDRSLASAAGREWTKRQRNNGDREYNTFVQQQVGARKILFEGQKLMYESDTPKGRK